MSFVPIRELSSCFRFFFFFLKKGFFFFLWAGEALGKIELHAWECRVVFAQREAGCVLTIPSVAVIDQAAPAASLLPWHSCKGATGSPG